MRFLIRRALHGLFLLAGVAVLTFLMTELAPGDYFDHMRLDSRISPETVAAMRARFALEGSLPERFGRWLASVARGDLGYSFAYNSPVAPLLLPRVRNTLLLSGSATALAWLVALPLGVWAAGSRAGWPRALSAASTSLLLAVPELLTCLALLLLALRTGWFPTGGMVSLDHAELAAADRLADLAIHLALPVAALAAAMLPVLVRHVQASVSEVLSSPFLRAVRGFGIPRRKLLFRHALRVAANPLISLFGISVAGLVSGSLLVEVVMSWPGIGPLLLESILARDVHVVIAIVLMSTVILIAGNLLADLLLYAFDPRIRAE